MKGDHKFRKKPKGAKGGGYVRARVQIGFDDDMRKAIIKRAKAHDQSFASEVRTLLATALAQTADTSLTSPEDMGFPE